MLAVFVLSIGVSVLLGRGGLGIFRQGPRFAEHLARSLPRPGDEGGLVRAVQQMHDELGIDVTVVDLAGNKLASSGSPIPVDPGAVAQAHQNAGWFSRPGIFGAPVRPHRGGPPMAMLLVRVT